MQRIFIFLADGFEEIEALAPVDVFRRAGMDVTTISINNDLYVRGAHDITIKADACFSDMDFNSEFLIFLPGGMPGAANLDNHVGLKKLIENQVDKGREIAAICAAPFVLGKMGLLKNKEAICYPGYEHLLKDARISSSAIVKSDNIFTAKGPGVAVAFALKIIENISGSKVAEQIAKAMIV
ncbi:MAG: DJ-1 family glyoxalase III [Paludibacter sp.]|nr:DJ-1 family glyoxalase III [Paludibacter sp.]